MLNENPHVLYQFYGKDSTVVVQEAQEEGVPPLSVTADNQQVDLRISITKDALKSSDADISIRRFHLFKRRIVFSCFRMIASFTMGWQA